MDRRTATYYARKQANNTERISYVIRKFDEYDFIHQKGLKDLLKLGWEHVEKIYPRGM